MILTLLILPILGSIISGLLGRYIGYKSAKYLTTLTIIITLLISLLLYYNIMINNNIYKLIIGK
jgi:NADH:ubiquinone oxidoreductase subunit 5 (subunit L)/multisubunit Na+/H+ antiporter MnhA subunit